ncbi:amidohydrolase family protein [Mycolicibacterium sp. 050158]|uniref:amidohydrolase family protein n=1 Tax=Mycolicibacterium sp. 050158 TaxID=3090602 RepID=UPI00299D08F4|nr:amidohydrolase family protein [Mycolicibacterium sp. 050158]MDX1893377.1 amidohydrolase family protein [Mycolicibacterium sp. 050158]
MTDEATAVRAMWNALELPGIVDVHTHFMPKSVMDKVWQYFDAAGPLVGRTWPITYRSGEADRVATLRGFGVRAFTSLIYPHKPLMAEWLNQWAAQFAAETPDCLATSTFFPEPGADAYVGAAIARGTRVFKAHVQVGAYDPNDPLLDGVWGVLQDAGTPVVIHCGSGPQPGKHTGPEPIRAVLARYPRLRLIVAHMGMPEYGDFLELCEAYPEVRLDTTMAFTPFVEETMPFPAADRPRLVELGDRILFGSDFPNIPYRYLEAIRVLTEQDGVDDAWLRGVLHDNAAQLFGLTPS